MDFVVNYSQHRIACMWEKGGVRKGKRFAQIIAGKDGQYKRPLMVNDNAYVYSEEHALLPISKNNYIVWLERDEKTLGNVEIQVFKVHEISQDKAVTSCLYHYQEGKWNQEPTMKLYDAIDSALRKSKDKIVDVPYFAML